MIVDGHVPFARTPIVITEVRALCPPPFAQKESLGAERWECFLAATLFEIIANAAETLNFLPVLWTKRVSGTAKAVSAPVILYGGEALQAT